MIFGESWLCHNGSGALIHIDGYKIFCFNRKVKNNMGYTKMGDGLCAYNQEGIEMIHLDHYSVSNKGKEAISLAVQKKGNLNLLLYNLYSPLYT